MESKNNIILIILDGFGISSITEGNAVYMAKTPVFDSLLKTYPTTLLHASGQEVGLEFGEMGNSEVGHLNLGTGRVILQDLPRINESIENKSFFQNKELLEACEFVKKNNSTLHFYGLASTGGIHSHLDHFFALLYLAKEQNIKNVAIHLITDGRDTPPKKALEFVKRIDDKIKQFGIGTIASVCGRFYAMDRDKHYDDRTKLAYDLLVEGKGQKFNNAQDAIESGYKNGETDENLTPKIINDKLILKENDALIFYNYRTDRVKQISKALVDPEFKDFSRSKKIEKLLFVTFTSYGFEPTPMVKIAFFSQENKNPLADVLASNNLTQLHIAETEKYAHVTYFFNGGQEKPFKNENRILVSSPRVTSYDQKPEMSAKEIASKFIGYFKSKKPRFTIINFANPDMVGHTGNLKATIKAIEIVDNCLKEILANISLENNQILITADHGNAEQMINPETHDIDKEHTTNPVPFIIVGSKKQTSNYDKLTLATLQPTAVLSDISTTILDFLSLKKSGAMTGQSLKDLF